MQEAKPIRLSEDGLGGRYLVGDWPRITVLDAFFLTGVGLNDLLIGEFFVLRFDNAVALYFANDLNSYGRYVCDLIKCERWWPFHPEIGRL